MTDRFTIPVEGVVPTRIGHGAGRGGSYGTDS